MHFDEVQQFDCKGRRRRPRFHIMDGRSCNSTEPQANITKPQFSCDGGWPDLAFQQATRSRFPPWRAPYVCQADGFAPPPPPGPKREAVRLFLHKTVFGFLAAWSSRPDAQSTTRAISRNFRGRHQRRNQGPRTCCKAGMPPPPPWAQRLKHHTPGYSSADPFSNTEHSPCTIEAVVSPS